MALPFVDVALSYDATTRWCDHVFNGVDLQLDATLVTPVLATIGSDRRAHTDDEVLADVGPDPTTPFALNPRRGWPGDALDAAGRLIGWRGWLLANCKQTDATLDLCNQALSEGFAWAETDRNLAGQVQSKWLRRNVLGFVVQIENTTLQLSQSLL